jgi:hypothetical protein
VLQAMLEEDVVRLIGPKGRHHPHVAGEGLEAGLAQHRHPTFEVR